MVTIARHGSDHAFVVMVSESRSGDDPAAVGCWINLTQVGEFFGREVQVEHGRVAFRVTSIRTLQFSLQDHCEL
jgi:hypothetical protein